MEHWFNDVEDFLLTAGWNNPEDIEKFDRIRSLLERDTAKEPLEKTNAERFDGKGFSEVKGVFDGYCPICSKPKKRLWHPVTSEQCFCETCGQRLKWSE